MPRPQSIASNLFKEIKEINSVNQYAFLMGIPQDDELKFEREWLEFKYGDAKRKDLSKIWSKALCGMANTVGGLVIWGITAANDSAKGVDCATSVATVPEVDQLITQLRRIQITATGPSVAGVEYLSIKEPGSITNDGFVVCYVPESQIKPHRVESSSWKDKPYFVRIGDSSVPASPEVLRQLFHPTPYHSFGLVVSGTLQVMTPTYVVSLCNLGSMSARSVTVTFRHPPQLHYTITEAAGWDFVEYTSTRITLAFDRPLHPGSDSKICNIIMSSPIRDGEVTIIVCADNIPAFKEVVLLTPNDSASLSKTMLIEMNPRMRD